MDGFGAAPSPACRAALGQFVKLTKHEVAVDEPSLAALEVVVARWADGRRPIDASPHRGSVSPARHLLQIAGRLWLLGRDLTETRHGTGGGLSGWGW